MTAPIGAVPLPTWLAVSFSNSLQSWACRACRLRPAVNELLCTVWLPTLNSFCFIAHSSSIWCSLWPPSGAVPGPTKHVVHWHLLLVCAHHSCCLGRKEGALRLEMVPTASVVDEAQGAQQGHFAELPLECVLNLGVEETVEDGNEDALQNGNEFKSNSLHFVLVFQ